MCQNPGLRCKLVCTHINCVLRYLPCAPLRLLNEPGLYSTLTVLILCTGDCAFQKSSSGCASIANLNERLTSAPWIAHISVTDFGHSLAQNY